MNKAKNNAEVTYEAVVGFVVLALLFISSCGGGHRFGRLSPAPAALTSKVSK